MKRHILRIILCLCLLLGLTTLASAAEVIASGECGGDRKAKVTWTLYDNGHMALEGGGKAMTNYASFDKTPWAAYQQDILTITVGEGVQSIGTYAFYGCTNLTRVELSEDVYIIYNNAFQRCTALETVVAPGLDRVAQYAFSDCIRLRDIALENVTYFGNYAFYGCAVSGQLNMDSTTYYIGNYAFYNCDGLTEVVLNNVPSTLGSYAFYGCENLERVTLPEKLTSIPVAMFTGCAKLEQINIPAGVKTISNSAFSGCASLKNVELPEVLTTIGNNAFSGTALTSVRLPQSLTSLGKEAFSNCKELESLSIPASVTSIGLGVTSGCEKLTGIQLDPANGTYCVDEAGVLYTKDMTNLCAAPGKLAGSYQIPDTVTTIRDGAFEGCTALTEVILPQGLTKIPADCFYGCTALKSVVFPDGLVSISYEAFYGCEALASVSLPGSLQTISGAFQGTGLTSLEFRDNNPYFLSKDGAVYTPDGTELLFILGGYKGSFRIPEGVKEIGFNAINTIPGLTEVHIPASLIYIGFTQFDEGLDSEDKWSNDYGQNFIGCKNLEGIHVDPANAWFSSMDGSLLSKDGTRLLLAPYVFENGTYRIPEGVTVIHEDAVGDRLNLYQVIFPETLKTIDRLGFMGCVNLKITALPESLQRIDDAAFAECTGGEEITLPKNVSHVGTNAFRGWETLKTVTLKGYTTCTEASHQYDRSFPETVTLKLHCEAMYGSPYDSYYDANAGTWRGYQAEIIHTYGETVIPPTCTEDGYTRKACINFQYCSKEEIYDRVPTPGHSYVEDVCTVCGVVDPEKLIAVGLCGDNLNWRLGVDGVLTIHGSGAMTEHTWDDYKDNITAVVMDSQITSIASSAFKDCTKLADITFHEGLESIGSYALSNTGIQTAILPDSLTTMQDSAFRGCTALKTVVLPGNVDISRTAYLFYSCTALTDVTLKEGVKNLGHFMTFQKCSSLETLTLPSSLTEIGLAPFQYCTALREIRFLGSAPKFDSTAFSDTNITAWYPCGDDSWTSDVMQDYSGDVTWKLEHSEYETITVDPTCTSDGFSYEKCSRCGDERDHLVDKGSMLDHSFVQWTVDYDPTCVAEGQKSSVCEGCDAVSREAIPVVDHSYEKDICTVCGGVDPEKLIAAGVLEENLTWRLDVDGVLTIGGSGYIPDFYDIDNPWLPYALQIQELVLDPAITGIGNYSFTDCTELSKVTFHEGLMWIGISSFENTALETAAFPASLEYIDEYAFAGCKKLSNVTFREGLEAINFNAFENTALETVALPISLEYLGDEVFSNCASLKEITIPHDSDDLEVGSEVFYGTENLTVHCYCDLPSLFQYETAILNWALEHREYEVWEFDPTCTEYGGSYEICSRCYEGERNFIYDAEPLGHVAPNGYYTSYPTCTEDGSQYGPCQRCWEYQTWTVPATGHRMDQWYTYQEPSCVVAGEKRLECFNCDYYESEVIPAYGEHIYEVTVYPPSCTEKGFTEYCCTRCYHWYMEDFVDALGHTEYEQGGQAPTCTKDGWEPNRCCSVCNDILYWGKDIPALGHDYESVTVPPTCDDYGYTEYICTRCNDWNETDSVDPLGHDEVIDPAVKPTCTENGLYEGIHCKTCGEVLQKQEIWYTEGHKRVTDKAVAATCLDSGLTEGQHCEACGEVFTAQEEIPALGHNTVTDEAVEPSCTESGWTEGKHCDRCGEVFTAQEEIPATGHSPVVLPEEAPTCTQDGTTEGSKCTVCDAWLKIRYDIPLLGHSYETTVTAPTCTEEGYTTYTCTRCDDSYDDYDVSSLGHNIVELPGVDPGCLTNGLSRGEYCTRCEYRKDQFVRELLGHDYLDGICQRCGDSSFVDAGRCGDYLTWGLTEEGTLIISGTGEMHFLYTQTHYWNEYHQEITSVVIEEGVTSIAASAFSNCKNLKEVTIPSTMEVIGNEAFYNCPVEKVHISDPAAWVSIRYKYYHSKPTGALYLGDELITELVLPEGITEISDYAFYRTEGLERVVIPEGVTTIGKSAFEFCEDLVEITFPSTLTDIGSSAFESCASLRSVVIPEGVTKIGSTAFYACEKLTDITIPSTLTEIGDTCFYNCNNLQIIRISDVAAWINIQFGSSSLPSVANPLDLVLNGQRIIDLEIPEGITRITQYSLRNTTVESVVIPKGVTEIGDCAFYGCDRLHTVEIPETVTTIGSYAFYDCSELRSIELPQGLQKIPSYAFYSCENLTELEIPEGVTEIGTYAFYDTGLTEVVLPDSVTQLGTYAFNYCDMVTLKLSEGLTVIPEHAFSWCENLEYVEIPENITVIGENAFSWCQSLKEIQLPDGITEIGNYAFNYCYDLEEIRIPGASTRIGNGTFYSCYNLRRVVITEGVETIEQSAFQYCSGLETLEFLGDAPYIYSNSFTSVSADAFYPDGNSTWTESKLQSYGGNLTWHPACPDGHELGDWEVTTPGHCRQDEIQTMFCADCDYYITKNMGKGDHISETITGREPTCTGEGRTDWERCSECYTTLTQQETIPALGHEEEVIPAVAPTCTASGKTEGKRCDRCNSTLVYQSTVDRLGHDYGEWQVTEDATCTSYGTEERQCSRCDATEARDISPIDHSYTAEVVDPDCENSGYTIYTCEGCGYEYYSDETYPLGHDFFVEVTPSTCTDYGYETKICRVCGYAKYWMELPLLEHTWDQGEMILEPDENNWGQLLYICTECGTEQIEEIPPVGHNHDYEASITPPTCVSHGFTTWTCSCGDSYVNTPVSATGHSYGEWYVYREPTCTKLGEKRQNCENCDVFRYDSIEVADHQFSEWEITLEPTGESKGEQQRSCVNCDITENREIPKLENPFGDVPAGAYYETPVLWAVGKGITTGVGDGQFAPDAECIRGQIVTFLWRAAGQPEPESDENPFTDVSEDAYYYKAVLWAVENGITSGMGDGKFAPDASCTRAQVATFLWRAQGEPEPASDANPFTDVPSGAWYETAVLWAVENGVTNGMGDGKFAPDATCTRGQIVTFLYRAMA